MLVGIYYLPKQSASGGGFAIRLVERDTSRPAGDLSSGATPGALSTGLSLRAWLKLALSAPLTRLPGSPSAAATDQHPT